MRRNSHCGGLINSIHGAGPKGVITRNTPSNILFSVVAVPLALSQWTPIPINSMTLPKFESAEKTWKITTKENAGGMAWVFPKREHFDNPAIYWTWKVEQFPEVSTYSPLRKKGDDYALRVGTLISGDKEMDLPPELAKVAQKFSLKLSYIVFYLATDRKEWEGRCEPNPFSDRVLNCFRITGKKFTDRTERPLQDLSKALNLSPTVQSKLSVAGLWVFADSDNSKSQSVSYLKDLKVEGKP